MTFPEDSQPVILVADDDRSLRKLLNLALSQEGYKVIQVSSGEQALQDFQRLQPNIVLLDAVMPEMDGFACCRHLRTVVKTDIPILMVTVLDDQASINSAFDAGATDYITKPIHWAVLKQRVRRLLSGDRVLKQVQSLQTQLQQARIWESLQRQMLRTLQLPVGASEASVSDWLVHHQADLGTVFDAHQILYLNLTQARWTTLGAAPEETQLTQSETLLTSLTATVPQTFAYPVKEGEPTEPIQNLAATLAVPALLTTPVAVQATVSGWLVLTRQVTQVWSETDEQRLLDLAQLIAFLSACGGGGLS
ncbi:MAG: response regulator [Cyanobacteria bacterium P01_H01_bin.58]